MPRVRIRAAYKTGNITGVALHQEGNKVALQVYNVQTAGAASTPTDTILILVENGSGGRARMAHRSRGAPAV
eukprot:scaffold18728_cov121-Isochrysis_galbana.AAC.3